MPPEDESIESVDTTATESVDTDSSGDQGGTEQAPAESSDWRVNKYGADFDNNIEYHRDTQRYLRGELDKAKRANRRTIDDYQPQQTARPPDTNGNGKQSPYADVQSVNEFGNRIESRFQSLLSERERDAAFRTSLKHTRETELNDPDSGIPSFADLEHEVLAPLLQKNPGILDVLKSTFEADQLGPAANLLAVLVKFKTWQNLKEVFAGQAREEMGQKINEVSREAVRIGNRRDGKTSSKITPEQIANMTSAQFAEYEAKMTGRRPGMG